MPKVLEHVPPTRLWVQAIEGKEPADCAQIINSWGWADMLVSLEYYNPDYTLAVFKMPPEVYALAEQYEHEQTGWEDPVSKLQQACAEKDRLIRQLRDELSEAKQQIKQPEKGQASLL